MRFSINKIYRMETKLLLASFLVLIVFFSLGCISGGGGSNTPASSRTLITPCNIVGGGVQIRADGEELKAEVVKVPLSEVFVDDMTSPQSRDTLNSFQLTCRWGSDKGEVRDYYYCNGTYKSPELDEKRVITRFIRKNFKIGFETERHDAGVWTDLAGKVHRENPYYYLVVKSVETNCYVE